MADCFSDCTFQPSCTQMEQYIGIVRLQSTVRLYSLQQSFQICMGVEAVSRVEDPAETSLYVMKLVNSSRNVTSYVIRHL